MRESVSNEVAENLREIASNLLAAANRLDGIDVAASPSDLGLERGVMVEVARDFVAELGQWSALCQVKIVPDGRGAHTLIGRRPSGYLYKDKVLHPAEVSAVSPPAPERGA